MSYYPWIENVPGCRRPGTNGDVEVECGDRGTRGTRSVGSEGRQGARLVPRKGVVSETWRTQESVMCVSLCRGHEYPFLTPSFTGSFLFDIFFVYSGVHYSYFTVYSLLELSCFIVQIPFNFNYNYSV